MTVFEILLKRLRDSHISEILVKQARARIKSKGADIGGYARLWADTARLNAGTKKKPKLIDHYRKGGTPLYDTGELFRGLTSSTNPTKSGVKLTLMGSMIAAWQSAGFKASGFMRIPFTRRASRETRTNDPKISRESMRFRGSVKVPARPIFAMPTTAKQEIARAIARALGAR